MSTSFPLQIRFAFSEFSQFPAPSFSPKHALSLPASLNKMRLFPGELSCSWQRDVVRWWKHQFHWVHLSFPFVSSGSKTATQQGPASVNNNCDSCNVAQPQRSNVEITRNDISFPISAYTWVGESACGALWLYPMWICVINLPFFSERVAIAV